MKSGVCRAIVLVLLVTSWLGSASLPTRAQTPAKPEISMRLQPTKKVFLKGEPITIRVELTNRGQRTLYVSRDLSGTGGSPANVRFTVWNTAGEPWAQRGLVTDCFMQQNPDSLAIAVMRRWIPLPPGSSFSAVANVGPDPFLERPGLYRVMATYESGGLKEEYWTSCVKATTEEIEKLPFVAWEGKAESNSVWIKIINPPKQRVSH